MIGSHQVCAIIPAAGRGRRMGTALSKQFLELDGRAILLRTLDRFVECPEIDQIVLTADPAERNLLTELLTRERTPRIGGVVAGGPDRQDSVRNAMNYLEDRDIGLVVVHDGVRPFIDRALLVATMTAADEYGAALAAVRAKETIKIALASGAVRVTPPRDDLWIAQTPQAFRWDILKEAFLAAERSGFRGTDDASLVEQIGRDVRIVEGSYDNIKITTPDDLALAGLILQRHQGNRRAGD